MEKINIRGGNLGNVFAKSLSAVSLRHYFSFISDLRTSEGYLDDFCEEEEEAGTISTCWVSGVISVIGRHCGRNL